MDKADHDLNRFQEREPHPRYYYCRQKQTTDHARRAPHPGRRRRPLILQLFRNFQLLFRRPVLRIDLWSGDRHVL